MKDKYQLLAGILLLIHLFVLLVIQFTPWPEMTLWPYLIAKGWLPYQDIAIAHTPLLLVDLSIFYKLFGAGILQLKIFTYLLVVMLDASIFIIAKKLWDEKTALFALAAYVILQSFYGGNGMWFDLYMALPILLTYYFLKQKDYLYAGVFCALSFLSKQTAAWFIFPILYHFWSIGELKWKTPFIKYIKGGLLTGILFILILLLFGIADDFWFWAVQFGVGTLPVSAGQVELPKVSELLKALLPFVPFVLLIKNKNKELILWAIAGFLGFYPRWELFHFQPALPFLAMGIGLVAYKLSENKETLGRIGFAGVTVLVAIMITRSHLRLTDKPDRFLEPEVLEVSAVVDELTEKNEPIYVANAWDNIYVFSGTVPPGYWVPNLEWYLELSGEQEKIVEAMERKNVNVVVLRKFGEYEPRILMDYINTNYTLYDQVGDYMVLTKGFVFVKK